IESMRSALARRMIDLLTRLASEEAEKYQSFWDEFGRVLKEGLAEDPTNRERIAKLLRFATTHHEGNDQNQSLEDYLKRMQAGQDRIYYLVADSVTAARSSPHLEIFRRKGVEVLLLGDRIDEWLVGQLNEFEGKRLQDVTRGDLELGALFSEADRKIKES